VKHEGKIKREELVAFLEQHALKEKKADPLLQAKTPKAVQAFSAEQVKTQILGDENKRLWAVMYHKGGAVPAAMEELAAAVKPLQYASVDCAKEAEFCKEQELKSFPVLRFYQEDKSEYEDFTGAATCEEDCMEAEAMTEFVSDNLPEIVVPVNEATFNTFLQPAVEVPRFILVTKKESPTLLYKSIALRYKGKLTFGLLANPPDQLKQQLAVTRMPMLMVFFSQEGEIRGGAYQGGFSWEEMTRWTDQFAAPFLEGGDAQKEKPEAGNFQTPTGPLPQISRAEGSSFEELCGGKVGLCAVAFVDGMPGSEEKRNEQIKVMEDVRAKMGPSPIHFSWVDATCHAEFANSLDATPDKLPAVAVIAPSKQRYFMHVGKFMAAEIQATLEAVLSGKKGTGPYSSIAELEKRDCGEVHAEIAAAMAGGGDDEDDEIMREMMEEIKRKEAEAAAAEEETKKKKKKKKKAKK